MIGNYGQPFRVLQSHAKLGQLRRKPARPAAVMHHRQINAAGQIVASPYGGGPTGPAQDFFNDRRHGGRKPM
jgi:hypothetical protein